MTGEAPGEGSIPGFEVPTVRTRVYHGASQT